MWLFIESTRAGRRGLDEQSRPQEINMSTSKMFLIHNELNRTSFIKLLRNGSEITFLEQSYLLWAHKIIIIMLSFVQWLLH